jgi:two-component system, response regulator YesN
MDEVQGKEFLDFSGIQFHVGLGIVISTKVDPTEIQSNLRTQMLRKRFLEKLKSKLTGMVSYNLSTIIKEYIYVFVIGSVEDELLHIQQKLRETIIEVSDAFASEYHLYTDFGIGDQYTRLDCMWKSFSTAKSYCNKSLKNHDVQRKQLIIGLIKSITEQDDMNFSQSIELVFEDILAQAETLEQLKIKVYELCISLRNEFSERIADKEIDHYDLYHPYYENNESTGSKTVASRILPSIYE